jgi:two-component system, OmpR family, response regulator
MSDSDPLSIAAAPRRYRCDVVELDVEDQCAWREGRPVALTSCEWTLLQALARGAGRATPRSTLLALLAAAGAVPSGNALNIHFCNLRRKFGRDVIQTIRGRGYRLAAPWPTEGGPNCA